MKKHVYKSTQVLDMKDPSPNLLCFHCPICQIPPSSLTTPGRHELAALWPQRHPNMTHDKRSVSSGYVMFPQKIQCWGILFWDNHHHHHTTKNYILLNTALVLVVCRCYQMLQHLPTEIRTPVSGVGNLWTFQLKTVTKKNLLPRQGRSFSWNQTYVTAVYGWLIWYSMGWE